MEIGQLNIFHKTTTTWFSKHLGKPTKVQEKAWPAIAKGEDTLVVAPTGTGKTLSAFLVFIDQLKEQARNGQLEQELQVIYISPLKSLAGDIRENLKTPLDGIREMEKEQGEQSYSIDVALRTGDTTSKERRDMLKKPPHILITTPESLYLLLTSKSGKGLLKTAKVIIIDEIHAMIDTKRGAHLMLSIARLDMLCPKPLQRIGLSATIEPVKLAAKYLSPEKVAVVAPKMKKEVKLFVTSPLDFDTAIPKKPIWEELAQKVYDQCKNSKSVIAFVEGRRFAEKLAYYVNQLGGEGFARTHHGSMSKEQRQEVEQALRSGVLRLLCATSSMELGIDVGDIDQVFQVGCPRTISSTLQRLGRAGHNPNRVSSMQMFPRASAEGLYCGITAEVARQGLVESCKPPKLCFDVLSQHLVSMATEEGYDVDDVMPILQRTYSFADITKEEVKEVLCMLAGDYEHNRDIPVRPRILYDRIHEHVLGDAYSRMLAISAGGTIPDKGMYSVKSEDGVKLGELDEEFVFEARVGERFLLGTFAWKISKIDKDSVIVTPTSTTNAKLPFWKGDIKGRGLQTGIAFGTIFRELSKAYESGALLKKLTELGLDDFSAHSAKEYLERQLHSTQLLPDDQTIVIEHFKDETSNYQMMVHSVFGRQINEPLSILANQAAKRVTGRNINHVADEDGFLLFPYDGLDLPEGILYQITPWNAKKILEAALLSTPLFNMTFRYNAARALMMGVRKASRQPLWVQRMRSAEMLDSLIHFEQHPLMVETKRECLEDVWDVPGVIQLLKKIQTGAIKIHEIVTELPSPMSMPFRQQTEGSMMYDYAPSTLGIQTYSKEMLNEADLVTPSKEELERLTLRTTLPQDENQLHSLLMAEGDMIAGELEVPIAWLEALAHQGVANYIEPGLWIAAEHGPQYESALAGQDGEELKHILRRALRYRGAQSMEQLAERYLLSEEIVQAALNDLIKEQQVIEADGIYYHAKLYQQARKETIKNRRKQVATVPASHYAALLANHSPRFVLAKDKLEEVVLSLCNESFSMDLWENTILPSRVIGYRPELLDALLAKGVIYWSIHSKSELSFHQYEAMDWEEECLKAENDLDENETILYQTLKKRGATFLQGLNHLLGEASPYETLLRLAEKGLVHADSFVPIRQYQNRKKLEKATIRQRVNVRVAALTAGRWEISHPLRVLDMEEQLNQQFEKVVVISRETIQPISWQAALEILRVWEYTGRVRRGYFVEGLSGIQFIREEDYYKTSLTLNEPVDKIVWMNAIDPAQPWGKCLPHKKDRNFMNIAGTFVALKKGEPIVVLERQGKTLRCFEEDVKAALEEFVLGFQRRCFFPNQNRLIIKEYPKNVEDQLKSVGFIKEIQDYVLYRK